jgi:predicted kinase
MIYLVGGAPRSGKSILGQQVSAKLRIGWISTDVLAHMLKVKDDDGAKVEWNATTEIIVAKLRDSTRILSVLSGVSAL